MVKAPAATKLYAIVLCCTPNWLPLAGATLLSCVQHGGAQIADFYVLTSASNEIDRQQFASFTQAHGFAAKVIDVTLPKALASFPTARFSTAALLRLTIDQHLPAHYTRVLYLDCDILCENPLAEIFTVNLNGKSLGAVEDYQSLPGPLNMFGSHVQKIGLPKGTRYFNSGVLLFDWKQTLTRKILPRCVTHILEMQNRGESYNLPDQDVLNLEFADDWQSLNLKFNLMAFFVDYFPAKPVFRHFSNRQKPWGDLWQPGFASARNFYRQTFAQSPWPEFAPGRYKRASLIGTGGVVLRKLDPISGRRYLKHLEIP